MNKQVSMTSRISAFLALALLFQPVVGAEQIFKYQDENGNWAYSRSLPPAGETAKRVVLSSQVATGAARRSSIPVSMYVFKYRDEQGDFVYSQYSPELGEFEKIKLSPDAMPHRGAGRSSAPLYAVIYKFLDAQGKWVYSQYLPSSAIPEEDIERLASAAPYSSAAEGTPSEGESSPATDDGQTGEQLARATESEKIRKENCRRARERLEQASDPRNDLLKTADGLYETVTEEKRAKLIETANVHVEEFCE